MKKLILTSLLLISGVWIAQSQGTFGEIMGKMYEKSSGDEPAYGATVWVMHSGAKIATRVDEEGRFRISSIPTGTYWLEANYLGDTLQEEIIVTVKTDGISNVGRINILEKIQFGEETVILAHKDPLVDFGDVGQKRISSKDIMLSPIRNDPGQLIVSRNSDIKKNQDGELMIRGSRAGDMAYFIDGIRTNSVQAIPSVAIGGITVYSTAIPAKYGDTTGGVIIMETKSYYDLWRASKMKDK